MTAVQQRSAVEAMGLTVSYDGRKALDGVTLGITPGSVVGLLGRNGAGKSTLIKALLGFITPGGGASSLLGEDSRSLSGELKARLGIVTQNPVFYNWLTGKQLIDYTSNFYPNWDQEMADRLVTKWELPADRAISNYSGGELQKLACILALSHRAELFVLDEPASSLDPVSRRQLLTELIELASGVGTTILFSTHIVSDLERIADRVVILSNGKVKLDMPLDSLKESVKRLRFFIGSEASAMVHHPALSNLQQAPGCVLALVTQFNQELKQALEKQTGVDVQVEDLSLEEIFLELNHD